MSGECDECGEHAVDCQCCLNGAILTEKSYDKHSVKYSIYEGNDHFYGTPVPEGYEAIYINDGFCPPSLQLRKKRVSLERHYCSSIPLSNDGIDPPSEQIPVKYVNVNGREEHEALLRDEAKMLELGLDPIYERTVYLKRWGDWLGK